MNTIAFFKPREKNTLASALWICVVMQNAVPVWSYLWSTALVWRNY